MGNSILADTGLDDGIAVSHGLATSLSANDATGATDIFNNDRLLENFTELFGHHAPHHVTGTTRREWHDQLDRLAGVFGLGHGDQGQGSTQCCSCNQADQFSSNGHGLSPVEIWKYE